MARYPTKPTFRTFVINSKTNEPIQVDVKDIPEERWVEFWKASAAKLGNKPKEAKQN